MRIALIIAMALALGAGLEVPAQTLRGPVVVNGIVAMVNDKVITREDIDAAFVGDEERLVRQYGRTPVLLRQEMEKLDRLRRARLEMLVENELILHEFESSGGKFPENKVEEYVKDSIREDFRDDLIQFRRTLQARGLTVEAYRRQIRERIIVNIMTYRNVSSSILVSPHKIETYYALHTNDFRLDDQVKIRMILLANKSDRDAGATKQLAQTILAKLDAGEAFKDLAKVHSEGSQRGEGGEWPWIEPSKLNEALAPIALSLSPGHYSGVIERPEGCYLLFLEDKRSAHVRALSEVRDEIERTLQDQEKQRLRQQWLDRLKARSFVKYFPLG